MKWIAGLFACKSVEGLIAQSEAAPSTALPRTLGLFSLTCFGVGSTIGAGIFVLTGTVAAQHAGPAIVLSFLLASVACAFAGLCYAEFAAMVPVAGSAYTYAYATPGEFAAWTAAARIGEAVPRALVSVDSPCRNTGLYRSDGEPAVG